VPADDDAVVMTVAPPDALAPPALLAGAAALLAGAAGAAALLLLPLEHAATSIATPTAPPTPAASLAGADIRFTIESLIVSFSCLVRPGHASPAPPK
jgi:hypothetical protein